MSKDSHIKNLEEHIRHLEVNNNALKELVRQMLSSKTFGKDNSEETREQKH